MEPKEYVEDQRKDALEIGIQALRAGKSIPDALYEVYQKYREWFVARYDPLALHPLALEDARKLEKYVNNAWTSDILATYEKEEER